MPDHILKMAVYSLSETLEKVGCSKRTLYRYVKEIPDLQRDEHDNYIFTDAAIHKLKMVKEDRRKRKLKIDMEGIK